MALGFCFRYIQNTTHADPDLFSERTHQGKEGTCHTSPCSFPNCLQLRAHWRMRLPSSTQKALTLEGSNLTQLDGRSQSKLLVALTIHHLMSLDKCCSIFLSLSQEPDALQSKQVPSSSYFSSLSVAFNF